MIKRKITILIAVAAVAIALVAAALFIFPGASADGYTIRASINEDCASAPWFVGDQIGYFKAHDVHIVDKGGMKYGDQPYAMLTGNLDVLDISPATLIQLLGSGAKVSGVALSGASPEETGAASPVMHWVVSVKSGYGSVQDLVAGGKTPKIGVSVPGFCMQLDASGWYAENGLRMGDLEFITIPDPQLEENVLSGKIDAAVLPQSFFDIAGDGIKKISESESKDATTSLGEMSLIVFTDDFIQKNPDSVKAFIQAYKGAERWINDHHGEAAEITKQATGMTHVAPHTYSDSGRITDDILKPWIEALGDDDEMEDEDSSLENFKKLYGRDIQASDLYTEEFSDLWTNSTEPQPLDPFPSPEKGAADVLDGAPVAARVRTAR